MEKTQYSRIIFFTRMHVCPFQGDECFGILCSSQPRERGEKEIRIHNKQFT
jgi:hypothetical protein